MIRITILFAFLSAIFAGLAFSDSWHIESVDSNISGDNHTSIALDSSDHPHISYHNYEYSYSDLKYAYWNGSTWSITSLDIVGGLGVNDSIALDSSDYPHISYACYSSDQDLKYAYWNGSTWSITFVDTIGDVGWTNSIALDSSDNPHISYYDGTNNDLKYAYWNGSEWSISTLDSVGDVGGWTSIALDSSDYPHISYRGNGDLKYAYWTGSEWSLTTVDSGGVGEDTSIALDSLNYPHISYRDVINSDLKYAYWTGSEWSVTTVDSGDVVGDYTSIALDSSDNPHISYLDLGNSMLKYAYWTGSEWSITSVDYTGYRGGYTSIALDSSDNPHISYSGSYDGFLKYAWYGPNTSVNLNTFSAFSSDNAILLNWSVETTEGEQIAGFNLYRREIVTESYGSPLQKNNGDWTQINSSLITGQNPYAYTDGNVHGGITYEYKLEAVLADESTEILGTASCAPTPPAFAITALYPNPASDVLNITFALRQIGDVNLELYDLSGRLVKSQNLSVSSVGEVSFKLDVSGLANGLYTLRATQSDQQAIKQVVIAR